MLNKFFSIYHKIKKIFEISKTKFLLFDFGIFSYPNADVDIGGNTRQHFWNPKSLGNMLIHMPKKFQGTTPSIEKVTAN